MAGSTLEANNRRDFVKRSSLAVTFGLVICVGALRAQPTITNESGESFLTIPPSVMLAMPPGNFGRLVFRSFATPVAITGTGLSAAFINAWYASFTPLSFK
jgi:hypothetical protein